MAHDSTKVVLGGSQASFKVVENRAGTIAAGTAVRLTSAGALSVAAADGSLLGISFGKHLSDLSRTAICRAGLKVPVLLTSAFTPTIGAQVHISDTTGLAAASGAGATGVNAVYASGVLTGLKEDGTTANVALIDFQGGL